MAIELNYACAECVQLTTNWSLAYHFLLTCDSYPDFHKMSFPEHQFNGAPKLFKMLSILCVSCVGSLMYSHSHTVYLPIIIMNSFYKMRVTS